MNAPVGGEMSYEAYAAWAASRYPGFRELESVGVEPMASAPTEAPASSDACPVTVRSNRDRVIVTPRIKRSL